MTALTQELNGRELERAVARIWERDAGELRRAAAALNERANRKESESVLGLSLDDAALKVACARSKPPTYFDLFEMLKHGQAAQMNVVQFYNAMRRSSKVRVNGITIVKRQFRTEHLE